MCCLLCFSRDLDNFVFFRHITLCDLNWRYQDNLNKNKSSKQKKINSLTRKKWLVTDVVGGINQWWFEPRYANVRTPHINIDKMVKMDF